MNNKYMLLVLLYAICIFTTHGQSSTKNELWINASLTSELFSVSPTEIGSFKNRNRIGASLGIESRKKINDNFSLNYGIQVKSFRKSFILNPSEVFINEINLHIPILLNYNLKLAKKHFANFKMGINGVLQGNVDSHITSDKFDIRIIKNLGIFPNLKFGFGYKFSGKRSFEVNVLYNMGFFEQGTEIVQYLPSETYVETSINGSFVELEFQYKLK
ncbi:porin family protein [Brumimicrobium mesophilum]|uniref:hypothetical protein n=1 Tax=Brumimicrobium mesophilum TaxID=392717 RepID=UPI000D143101|nr:hypothetical protein [Brumimicrobium mesophilum]